MTLSYQQLFVINDCFETQPQTHILCCRWESGGSLNLIAEFSLLKSENKSILFLSTTVFSQLLIWQLWWNTANFMFTTKNYWWEKVVNYILPRLSTGLHWVTIAKRNFHPSGVFWTTGGMGLGGFRQVKKRRHQLFKQQILLPLYHWHACRIILQSLFQNFR